MLEKHSILNMGHKTSISLEPEFWNELIAIAKTRGVSIGRLISGIDAGGTGDNLSSRIRVFILNHIRENKS